MNDQIRLGLLLAAAGATTIATVWLVIRMRRAPQDLEQKRRLDVNARGRLLDGMVTDATAETIYYSYSIAGMSIAASQDVAKLRDLLPEDPARLVGAVTLKYVPGNLANSIVVCEHWSGLRSGNK